MGIRKRTLSDGKICDRVEIRIDDRDANGRRKKVFRQVRTLREARKLELQLKTAAAAGGHVAPPSKWSVS